MIYAVYERQSDTCGNSDIIGPIKYVQAENEEEIRELYPRGFLCGYEIKEIEVETVNLIRIKRQFEGDTT